MTQKEALDILKLGNNVFLTGPPGSGKTFLLNKYVDFLKKKQKGVAITASTGIAATHIGGITLHSWSGLGIKEKLTTGEIKKLLKKSYLRKRFKNINILIIDEVSMLHAFQFDLLNQICQAFKNSPEPFGGMQIVCCGDLFQLPPVQKKGEAKFITEAEIWKNMDIKICYLEEQHRQTGGELLNLLNHIRNNAVEEAKDLLSNSNCEENTFSITPTKLYTHNIDVDVTNHSELDKIKAKEFVYLMEENGNKDIVAVFKKGCLAPERLVLKQGAKVMFIKNNLDKGYVNGTIGRIIGFNKEDLPIVETLEKRHIIATPTSWTIEEDGVRKAEISQIPLRLAWTITIHKSQGMNLDAAEIDLSKCFLEGMGYVALSRLRSLDGLKLTGINEMAFLVNKKILELDKILKQMSEKVIEDYKEIFLQKRDDKQKQFLHSLPQVDQKAKKAETISTYEQTKALVIKKYSIKEIMEIRGLTESTVLQHLEKLVICREKIDLEYLKPTPKQFEKIKTAFQQANTWQLTPVRKILDGKFSYNELRIVRLFIKDKIMKMHIYSKTKTIVSEKEPTTKINNCQNCNRPIRHRGNCLSCNMKAGRGK